MFGKIFISNLGVIAFGLLLYSCSSNTEHLPYYNSADFTPLWLDDAKKIDEEVTHRINDFSFTDQEGQTITREAVDGKIHVANFFFTSCPSICPKMTGQFEKIQEAFKDENDVVLLSFSVTPWIDSVARLKEYAKDNGVITSKWHMLTGDKGAIYKLARRSYFAEETPGFTKDSTEFLHTENFILVDKHNRIRGIYKGTILLDTQRLIDDIKILLQEN